MQGLMVVGFIVDEILRVDLKNDKSHWSMKYRARSVGQCGCKVGTSRRSQMQGLMVVGFIVDEILRVGFKNDKVTGARNIGQGH